MMDPVTLPKAITATQALTRLTEAVTEPLTLRDRMRSIRAAVTVLPLSKVSDHEDAGASGPARPRYESLRRHGRR